MKTPINDASTFIATPESEDLEETMDVIDAATSRRLELDRAALMECCRDFCSKVELGEAKSVGIYAKMMEALSTARANFP